LPPAQTSFLKAQIDRVNKFDKLVELRNRTVVGHDFEGVSLDKIRTACPKDAKDHAGQPDPIGGMRQILGALKVDLCDNPYQRIAEFVAQQLQES